MGYVVVDSNQTVRLRVQNFADDQATKKPVDIVHKPSELIEGELNV